MASVVRSPAESGPRLLVMGAGPAQLGLLEAAKAQGVWTAVCDRNPGAPGFALADRRCIVSTEDEPAIERLAAALSLDGVIAPGSDWAVAAAARVAERLGLAHPLTPAVAMRTTHKQRQREALAAAGVPQPRWQAVADYGEGLAVPLPFVVKAPDRQGQKGLSVVEEEHEYADAFLRARAASRGSVVLVEEVIEGPEVSVTGFCAGGVYIPLAVTDTIVAEAPAFGVALAHLWPSHHGELAVEVARRAVEAVGIGDGPSQVVLRITRCGPEVISVAARLGAGHDAELVQAVTGVELNALALAAALGTPVAASEVAAGYGARVGGAATRFLVAPPGELEYVEVMHGLPGVVATRIYRESSHAYGPLERAADRAGAVLAVGGSREDALARAESAALQIRFVTADAEILV